MGNKNRFLVAIILLVLLAVSLSGQATTGSITGTVKNEEGKRLAGVLVTATNIKNNADTTTSTGKKGTFRLMGLPPGSYQVSFDLEGYQAYVVGGIQLNADQSVTLRIKLKKKQ